MLLKARLNRSLVAIQKMLGLRFEPPFRLAAVVGLWQFQHRGVNPQTAIGLIRVSQCPALRKPIEAKCEVVGLGIALGLPLSIDTFLACANAPYQLCPKETVWVRDS